ncbi:MAG: hypothetical protein ACP5QS_03455, partial [bacterium]
ITPPIAKVGAEVFWEKAMEGLDFASALKEAAKAMTKEYAFHKYALLHSKYGLQFFYGWMAWRDNCYPYLYWYGKPWGGRTEEELKKMGSIP